MSSPPAVGLFDPAAGSPEASKEEPCISQATTRLNTQGKKSYLLTFQGLVGHQHSSLLPLLATSYQAPIHQDTLTLSTLILRRNKAHIC